MSPELPRYAVNCSIIFTELPLVRRFAAARAAGFEAVELWWPFASAVPSGPELYGLERAIVDAGVRLVGLNFYAGDMAGGDRGVLSWPDATAMFRENVDAVVDIGQRLGCRTFNALYGNRLDTVAAQAQDEVAVQNLALAASAVASIDGTVVVEPLSGAERYPLVTAADVMGVLDRTQSQGQVSNLALLADLYHLATNGDDVSSTIATYGSRIGHVQIADSPGRHEPGTGGLPLARYEQELREHGYHGWVGLEYRPSGASEDSFAWLDMTSQEDGS